MVRILTELCCYYRQDSRYWTVHISLQRGFCPSSTPPYTITFVICGIGSQLTPVHLQRIGPREVRCYTLIMRWQLLSLRSSCFRTNTTFVYYSRLGTLTTGRVVPPSDNGLTPPPSLPSSTTLKDYEFDRETGNFSPWFPNQCFTLSTISDEAVLTYISEGTSY